TMRRSRLGSKNDGICVRSRHCRPKARLLRKAVPADEEIAMRLRTALIGALLGAAVAGCAKKPGLVEQTYFAGNDYWVAIINQNELKDSNDLVPICRDL